MTQTQVTFGLLFGVFTLSMVDAGRLVERWGARPIAAFDGLAAEEGRASESRKLSRLVTIDVDRLTAAARCTPGQVPLVSL